MPPGTLSRIGSPGPLAGYLAHQPELEEAIRRVLSSGRYILGPEVAAFEQEFAAYLGSSGAVGVASGTDALHLALRACGVGADNAVMTVAHTAAATVAAIELAGALPVLVDSDPQTYTMDPGHVKEALTACEGLRVAGRRLKAVIPVHLYGQPADMLAILDLAHQYGLHVIEDCAQAHGAAIRGEKVGTYGDLSAFSFYPTKNLAAFGDGGGVAGRVPTLLETVSRLREYGWRERYVSDRPGVNSRLDELQAAVLRVKLRYLDDENARRRQLAALYCRQLSGSSLVLPRTLEGATPVYHQFVVRTPQRDTLREWLAQGGVETAVHYPMPVHLQPAYRGRVAIGHGGLQNAEQTCREILSLPMGPQLNEAEVCHVSELILAWERRAGQ